MQGTQVQSLVWEDPTCCGATKPEHPHGGSEKPENLEVGGASRDSTGFGALEEGLISS